MLIRKALGLSLLSYLGFVSMVHGIEQNRIGVVMPLSAPYERIGKQMQAGARAAAEQLGVALIEQDEVCTPEGGQAAANAMVAQKATIVVGFTCFESLNAALPILRDAGIATITTGVRADVLTDNKAKTEYALYRLAPREDMEVNALIAALDKRWRAENFAIIDDGTVLARNTAESLRFALTESGLKPVFTDTFRPGLENQAALVRRLQKAGATHVFVGGDVEDALVISKAAQGTIEIAIGESADPQYDSDSAGSLLSVALPNYRLQSQAASASLAIQRMGLEPDNYALSVFASIEIATAAMNTSTKIVNQLSTATFKTALGDIAFDQKGDLQINPFALVKLKNGTFQPDTSTSQ